MKAKNLGLLVRLLASSLLASLVGHMATVAVPTTAMLALSLLPLSAHAQGYACENTPDFDGDDPDPCSPPAQVDSAATRPADSQTQSAGGPMWNSPPTASPTCGGCTT